MLDFNFYNPVNIEFGKSSLKTLPRLLENRKKILLVYGGGSIKENGIYHQVKKEIENKLIIEFGGIESNPEYETLVKAVQLGREENIDFILAVGGGSVIDGTKFIAAAICFEDPDLWKVVTKSSLINKSISFGTVLTLSATGSEMNPYSVISRRSIGEKRDFEHDLLYPEFSILDPTLTFSLPKKQIGNGIVDAFVHVLEQYLTYPVNTPLQDRFAEGILKTLLEEGPKTYSNLNDYESRANLMWCATMALNGLISKGGVGDWATHKIGHELTALYGIDHARTLAVILPGLLKVLKEFKKEKIMQLGERVFNINLNSTDEIIKNTILKIEEFFHEVGVPTKLSNYNITKNDFKGIVDKLAKRKPFGEHENIDSKMIEKILLANL